MDRTTPPTHQYGSPGAGWSWPRGATEDRPGWRRPWADQPGQPDQPAEPRPSDTREWPHDQPPGGTAPASQHGVSGRRRGTGLLVAVALVAGAVGGGATAGIIELTRDDQPAAVSSLDRPPAEGTATGTSGVQEVANQVLPSVVSIAAGRGGGSGVLISSDGQILTNNHVVAAAQGSPLRVTLYDGTTAEAELVGGDELSDLAVIQLQDGSGLQPAELGSSADLQVGEQVVAIGSPLGLEGTVTSGIISALDRPVTAGDRQGGLQTTFTAIQTDAPINPGNSGGPLVNTAGQVVGINSAIATLPGGSEGSIGVGFSIPIDQARVIAEQLVETGSATHAMLEIGVNDATGETPGAVVADLRAGGAGEAAGLQTGDVITRVDERLVTDANSLIAAVRSYRPGDEVELTVVRDGETLTLEVTLGSSAPAT